MAAPLTAPAGTWVQAAAAGFGSKAFQVSGAHGVWITLSVANPGAGVLSSGHFHRSGGKDTMSTNDSTLAMWFRAGGVNEDGYLTFLS